MIYMAAELNGPGVTEMRSANGLHQVLLPQPPEAKIAVMQNRKMKSRSQTKPKTSEALRLEITGTKKFATVKRCEKRSA